MFLVRGKIWNLADFIKLLNKEKENTQKQNEEGE